jgi:hypothetical protein
VARRSRKRDYGAEHVPLDVDAMTRGWARGETGTGGREWKVRTVSGGDKPYRCPGCQQLIDPGAGHLVVWPADHLFGDEAGLDDRRHWHTSCWRRRR